MVDNWTETLIREDLETKLPGLSGADYRITSPATYAYNCIAWAAGETSRKWWPLPGYYWPEGAAMKETIAAFVNAFELRGYEIALNPDLEPGIEKIVIYVRDQKPTHAARQLEDGTWTSKLGDCEDIIHASLEDISGSDYGFPYISMWRRR